ncbi:MAG: hypothetical protein N4J56_004129 [Chroococcidiopsis sp. SAG 2025]|uniref:DUF305 domain-containing protein n=1 Tax=Chroococcidiopsis sp. SAG 2025 TaxID=171389 RepID=UPI002937407F|nr:DUF305 domain-containing protein [Chroococcidiopsis sp. SAG 2025]MDV2994475.1 hypothetical protein [Chroococcidiopsis sp. SAG 2025]
MSNQLATHTHPSKKAVIYIFVGLLAGSAIATLLTTASNLQAQERDFELNNSVPSTSVAAPTMAVASRSERHYIEWTIFHDEQAIAIADLALSRATHQDIKTLAAAMKQTKTQELQQLQAWYRQWYGTNAPSYFSRWQHRDLEEDKPEQYRMHVMETDLAELKNAPDFEREFLRQTIASDRMAMMMSATILDGAERRELRDFARATLEQQQTEVEQMQQWYQDWDR